MAQKDLGVFDDPLMLGLEDNDEPEAPVDDNGQASGDPVAAAQQTLEGAKDDSGPDSEPDQTPDTGQVDQAGQDGQPEDYATQGQPQLILGKFKSTEDLIRSYQELEKKLGSRDQEKEELKQQVAALANLLQQTQQQLLATRAVQDGQGAFPVPGQASAVPAAPGFAPQQAQAVPTPQIDPEEFRDALYSGNPVEAIMQLVTPLVTQQVQQLGQQINAGLTQIVQPIQQYAQQQQAIRSFEEQLADVRRQYADAPEGLRPDDLLDEMSKVFDEDKRIATLPNAMYVAYWQARTRKLQELATNQAARAENQVKLAQKQAARITTSGIGGPQLPRQKTPEELIIEETFGSTSEPKGIFDD